MSDQKTTTSAAKSDQPTLDFKDLMNVMKHAENLPVLIRATTFGMNLLRGMEVLPKDASSLLSYTVMLDNGLMPGQIIDIDTPKTHIIIFRDGIAYFVSKDRTREKGW